MNKSQLISSLIEKRKDLVQDDISKSIDIIINLISKKMSEGHRIELRNFGSFSIRARQKRISRNPKTGSAVLVDSKYYPYFRSSKNIKELLNK